MRVLRVLLWRGSSFKKLIIIGTLMFVSCWVTILVLQNTQESSMPGVAKLPDQKIIFLPAKGPRQLAGFPENTTAHKYTEPVSINNSNIALNANIPRKTLLSTKEHTKEIIARIDTIPSLGGSSSLELLRDKLHTLNNEERILNADKFPPLTNNDIVLIVQTHKRVGYLRELFNSLRAARGIERVLLVISSDYYLDEINQLVESVEFCKVIQIFYPFSLQVFPASFPGQSKNDCPRDVTRQKAVELNCTNALHPDSYGHYREATVTAIKHHWWWKVNTVFDHLRVTADFSGYVIFLEEDHYVSPDFVHVAKKLIALKRERCPNCDFINLGTYQKSSYSSTGAQAIINYWNAGKNNMGFGMDRSNWNTIKGCRENFCKYDDYNWDWSLNSLGDSCLHRKLQVLVVKAPRMMHIGTCGTHHHMSCNEPEQARHAREKFSSEAAHLFPETLFLITSSVKTGLRALKNYGGWGDVRDHKLCLSFVKP